jgi:hypothetical protein
MSAKDSVSISLSVLATTFFSGELYLTRCSGRVNSGFVNRYRGKEKSASTKESDKHHEKDLGTITWTLPDTGHSRVVACRANGCRAHGQLHPNNQEAREKEQESQQARRGDAGHSGYPGSGREVI